MVQKMGSSKLTIVNTVGIIRHLYGIADDR